MFRKSKPSQEAMLISLREQVNSLDLSNTQGQSSNQGSTSTRDNMQVEKKITINEQKFKDICDGLISYVNTFYKKENWAKSFIQQVNDVYLSNADNITKFNTIFKLVDHTTLLKNEAYACLVQIVNLKRYSEDINKKNPARVVEVIDKKFNEYSALAEPVIKDLSELEKQNEAIKLQAKSELTSQSEINTIKENMNKTYEDLDKAYNNLVKKRSSSKSDKAHQSIFVLLRDTHKAIATAADIAERYINDKSQFNIDKDLTDITSTSAIAITNYLQIKELNKAKIARDKQLSAMKQNSIYAQPSTSTATNQPTAKPNKKLTGSKV